MAQRSSQTGSERLRRFRKGQHRIDYFPSARASEILWDARWSGGDSKLLDRIILEWKRVTGNANSEGEFPDTISSRRSSITRRTPPLHLSGSRTVKDGEARIDVDQKQDMTIRIDKLFEDA